MRFVVGCVREWSKYCQWSCSPVLSIVWNYDIYRAFWGAVMSYPPPFIKNFHLRPRKHNLAALSFCQTLIQPWYKSCEYWVSAGIRERSRRHQIQSTLATFNVLFFPQILSILQSPDPRNVNQSKSANRNELPLPPSPLFPLPHISCSLNFPWRDAIAEIG